MNSAQKIVKYFAIGFACFLIFTILSGIVFGGLGILTATKLIKDNSHVEISCEANESPCLMVSLGVSELEVKKGETLKAESNYDKIEIKQDGDKLVIAENGGSIFDGGDRKVTVYVPEDMEFLKVGISGGAGKISVDGLKTKEMEVSLGIGETSISGLEVDKAKINAGIGRVALKLASDESKYAVKMNRGIGDIKFNGQSISNDSWVGSGDSKIEISGGIGEINVETADKKADDADKKDDVTEKKDEEADVKNDELNEEKDN